MRQRAPVQRTKPVRSVAKRRVVRREKMNAPGSEGIPSLGDIGLMQFAPALINRIAAAWNADLQDELRSYGLTTAKMRTLAVLALYPQLTINELATLTVMEQSTMSRTLDALEEADMVQRLAREDDLRVRDIAITTAGRAAFNRFWPVMHAKFRNLFSSIDDREYRAFVATLQKLLRAQTSASQN